MFFCLSWGPRSQCRCACIKNPHKKSVWIKNFLLPLKQVFTVLSTWFTTHHHLSFFSPGLRSKKIVMRTKGNMQIKVVWLGIEGVSFEFFVRGRFLYLEIFLFTMICIEFISRCCTFSFYRIFFIKKNKMLLRENIFIRWHMIYMGIV